MAFTMIRLHLVQTASLLLLSVPFSASNGWAGVSPVNPQSTGQPIAQPTPTPQVPRDDWKDCLYNEKVIRCQDIQTSDRLRILWIDGIRSTFWKKPPSHPDMPSYWADRYGGLWRRELLIQGNTQLTNLSTGNRIVVPLRYPCKPPAKGEVGYCRE